jgi:hypothetical protein
MNNKNAVSYETALKLKEAGLEMRSMFYIDPAGEIYSLSFHESILSLDYVSISDSNNCNGVNQRPDIIKTYTFAELWAVLPYRVIITDDKEKKYSHICLDKVGKNENELYYQIEEVDGGGYLELLDKQDNITEAAAQMVLKAKEKGWIK